jgi:DNA replicative helicase MCM subunit Mcm2 (Cdc46/Mcm family)
MQTNNLHIEQAVRATLTGQPAIAAAANTKAQDFRRQEKPIAAIDFDLLFENDDG